MNPTQISYAYPLRPFGCATILDFESTFCYEYIYNKSTWLILEVSVSWRYLTTVRNSHEKSPQRSEWRIYLLRSARNWAVELIGLITLFPQMSRNFNHREIKDSFTYHVIRLLRDFTPCNRVSEKKKRKEQSARDQTKNFRWWAPRSF